MNQIYAAIGLLAVAAMIEVFLLTRVLQKREPPKVVVIIHRLLAATALTLVIIHTVNTGADLVQVIGLFVIAGLGGLTLFVRDISGRILPKVTAFVFTFVYAFNK